MSNASQTAKAVFGRAAEIESPEDRSAYFDEPCANEPEIHTEVEEQLRATEQAGSFMARPIV